MHRRREFFARGVMGRYAGRMAAASNIVRIADDLTNIFPNESAVNDALRVLVHLKDKLDGIVMRSQPKRKKTA